MFPGEGEVTDAAVVLLRKKMSGKYTLFKVGNNSLVLRFFIIGTSLPVVRDCKGHFEMLKYTAYLGHRTPSNNGLIL